MLGRLAGMLALVCAVSPTVAHAGTLSDEGFGFTFRAAPGEVNDVRIYRAPSGAWAIEDHGAKMTAELSLYTSGYVCLPVKQGFHCTDSDIVAGWSPPVSVHLGDGDDALSGFVDEADAGPGDDRLDIGTSSSRIELGAGNDRVRAGVGPYTTSFSGGDGNDTFDFRGPTEPGDGCCSGAHAQVTGGDGADRVTGSSGYLTVNWLGGLGPDAAVDDVDWRYDLETWRTTGVTVSADGVADDGAPGEGDDVTGAAWVFGTSFADVLRGGTGRVHFEARDGNDVLTGSTAAGDYLDAGNGDDVINADDGLKDAYACSTGNDLADLDAFDVSTSDLSYNLCETVI